MVSLKRIDEDTVEQTEKQDGKIIRVTHMTISKDAKSMEVESSTPQGATMSYTAEKPQ
jgi:hypothetical protein